MISLKKYVPVSLKRAIKNLLGMQQPAKPASAATRSPKKRTGGIKKTGAGASRPRTK